MAGCKEYININRGHDGIPGKDGHGLLNVDTDVGVPSLSAIVKEIVTSEYLLTTTRPTLYLTEI